MDETNQGKKRTSSERIIKFQTLSIIDLALTFFRHRAASLPATCNQMNAPRKQLRSKKVRQCAWFIPQDIDQDLSTQISFHYSCYGALLARRQNIQLPRAFPFISFTEVLHVQSSLETSVKAILTDLWKRAKGFAFAKSLYVQCFSSFSGRVISDH